VAKKHQVRFKNKGADPTGEKKAREEKSDAQGPYENVPSFNRPGNKQPARKDRKSDHREREGKAQTWCFVTRRHDQSTRTLENTPGGEKFP